MGETSRDLLSSARDIDYSKIDNYTHGEDLAKYAGLSHLDHIVQNHLNSVSERYFFEYSILSSTINPNSSRLYSFAGVRTKNESDNFNRKVNQYVSPIIDVLYPSQSSDKSQDKVSLLANNWFHNPEMFLLPNIKHLKPLIIKDTIKVKDETVNIIRGTANCKEMYSLAQDNFYVSNMTYPRTLEEMLQASNKIVSEVKAEKDIYPAKSLYDVLHDKYRDGATTLKSYYDNFIAEDGEKYIFVTFPIISTQYKQLPELYRKYLGNYIENDECCQGLGHFFLYFKQKEDVDVDDEKIYSLCDDINKTISYFSTSFVFNTGLALADKVRKEAVKSAVAAIMSRNMSHNLGSHVITNTKSRVIEIAENSKEEQTIELLGLASLLHYIQERQDFIAVVTGDEKYAKTVINFKSHVFDMLAYDGPAIRHKTSTTPQQKNYILDNIVRSENYDRNNIELILEIPLETDKSKYKQLKSKQRNPHSNDFNNIFLSIPYGINGRQGFLSILENFIRNSAKHDKNPHLHNLDFTIRIEDDKDDENKKSITIYDNKGNAQDVIDKLKNIGLLDPDRKLRSGFLSITEQSKHEFKGIKEMLICVAWLQGNHGYTEALDTPADFLNIIDVDDNFGINFSLDKHSLVLNIDKKDNQNKSADIYYTQSDEIFEKKACKYPRLVKTEEGEEYSDTVEDFEKLYEEYFEAKYGKLLEYKIYVIDIINNEKTKRANETFCFIDNGEIKSDDISVGIVSQIKKHSSFNKDVRYNIIFKNHYETFGEDKDFEIVEEDKFYLEGISGANYTHSLLRNGNFDKMKAMRIIESCCTKILIVDERLYDKYDNKSPKTERPFTQEMISDILNRKDEFYNNKKYNISRLNEVCNELLKKTVTLQATERIKDDEHLTKFLSNFEIKNPNPKKNYGDYFRGKNIDIADYRFKDQNSELNFISNSPLEKYDFVSIHYGLIEKYAENINETDVKEALVRFIREEINNEVRNAFVSIHSGRGDLHKFKEKGNGQSNVTFIPLSGLEWVLENCKYTTTELFFSEMYHPIMQNRNESNN